jgi:DNA gyrase subunit B
MHEKEGVSALQVVMTKIGAGGKFDKDAYKVSGGLHGVGVSCVNALSIHLKAEVHRDGKVYEQEYSRGKEQYAVREAGTTDRRGPTIEYQPDEEILRCWSTTTTRWPTVCVSCPTSTKASPSR